MEDGDLDRQRFEWEREKARSELELNRDRFGLEQKKDARDAHFLSRNIGILITAATTVLGLVLTGSLAYFAHTQTAIDSARRFQEAENNRLDAAIEQDRQLSKDLREFVIKYYPDSGASKDAQTRFLTGLGTFPQDKVAPLLAHLSQSAPPEQVEILRQATAATTRITEQKPDAAWCYQEKRSDGTFGAYCHLSEANCVIAKQGSKTATSCTQVSGLGAIHEWQPIAKGLLNSWYQQHMTAPLPPPFPQPD